MEYGLTKKAKKFKFFRFKIPDVLEFEIIDMDGIIIKSFGYPKLQWDRTFQGSNHRIVPDDQYVQCI